MSWEAVEAVLPYAKVITWEGCHKIYVLMDDEQVAEMREYGYADTEDGGDWQEVTDPAEALATLKRWFEAGERFCGLQFINAVKTVPGNPNDGFQTLIEQFEFATDEEEDEEVCEDCGDALGTWGECDNCG